MMKWWFTMWKRNHHLLCGVVLVLERHQTLNVIGTGPRQILNLTKNSVTGGGRTFPKYPKQVSKETVSF
jgi:hypothetical protein